MVVAMKQGHKGTRGRRLATGVLALGFQLLGGCCIHVHLFENVRLPERAGLGNPGNVGGLETRPTQTRPTETRPTTAPPGVIDRMLKAAADAAWK